MIKNQDVVKKLKKRESMQPSYKSKWKGKKWK